MMQKFEFKELELKGAFLIKPFFAYDNRGGFIKDYNVDVFKEHGINHELKEVFYTISKKEKKETNPYLSVILESLQNSNDKKEQNFLIDFLLDQIKYLFPIEIIYKTWANSHF